MMISFAAAALSSTLLVLDAAVQPEPDPATLDLIREARTLTSQSGESVWLGFSHAPDSLLLIEGETEFLLCHEGDAAGFSAPVTEPVTGCTIRHRARQFPPNLLASFPAVDGVPTTVVGTPQATGRDSLAWTMTLLHEHLHQMQDAQPGAWQALEALDLDSGDQSGMWMLNYAFPYENAATVSAARSLADAAHAALDSADAGQLRSRFEDFLAARRAFLATVSPADARYYEFQSWKEGVARWTELAIARAGAHESGALATFARQQSDRLRSELRDLDLAQQQRVAFYALGAAEAELLEWAWPRWQHGYWDAPYNMGQLLDRALTGGTLAEASD